MEKENKKMGEMEILGESEKKLNVSYIDFIEELIKEKIEIGVKNKEKIIRKYGEIVKLRFNNCERVIGRVEREEVKEKLEGVLKERDIEYKKFLELNNKVRSINKVRNGRYI